MTLDKKDELTGKMHRQFVKDYHILLQNGYIGWCIDWLDSHGWLRDEPEKKGEPCIKI